MSDIARTIGPGRFLANVFLTVLVFIVVGPLVGELAMFCLSAINARQGIGAGVMAFIFSFLLAWPAAYIAGGPAAAVTGLIVATASRWIARPGPLYAVAAVSGAITGAFFFYAVLPLSRALVTSRGLGSFVAAHARDLALLAVVGAVAAILCTWLTKRWRNA